MAINVPHHKNYQVIILLALLFCIFTYPVASETAYVNLSGGTQNDFDCTVDGDIITVHYIDVINFNNIEDVGELSYIFFYVNSGDWNGPDSSAQWASVTYKVGAATIGTGQFGYNSGGNTHIVMAYINEDSWNIGALTGAQEVSIVGSIPSIYIKGPTHPVCLATSGFPSDEVPWFGKNVAVYGSKNIVSRGAGANQTSYFYQSIYEESYSFTYDNTAPLTVNVTRPALSQIDMYNGFVYVLNESSYQDNTPFDVISPDFVNDTWDITVLNAFSDVDSVTIDFSLVPQTEDTIVWGADSYVVDDTGSYSWYLSDSNWDTVLYSKKASIYRDETMVHEVSLPTQTGTFYYTFEEEGSFTVKLRHTSALLPHVTIDSDTVNVIPIGDSYIHVNNTIVVGQHFDIDFSYGFTPKYYFVNGVRAKYFHEDSNEWLLEKTWGVSDLYPMTANTIYQVSGTHTINFEGDYIFELYDFDNGVVATTPIITAIFDSTTPTLNISTSYINISKTDYVMGEIMDGFYGIDNDNYTYNNYLVVYNYQHDTTSMDFPLIEQASGFYGTLVQTDIHGDWIASGEIPAIPGNNKISLYAENTTTRFEIAYVNFTVSAYDEDGYGLQLSTYDACINEEVLISVISPSDANLTIFSPTGMPIKTYTLNGSTTIKYWFPTSGMYSLELYKSGEGISRATVTIYISDCADDGIIEPPSGEMDDMYLNMFNFMTLPIFWGMIIFVGFIGGLSMKTNRNGDHLVSGNGLAFIAFGLLNLLAFIGMLAPYTMYAIVSTWIFAGIFFGVGRYLARGE